MKNKCLKRTLAVLLAGITVLSTGGCGKQQVAVMEPMEVEEVYTMGFDFIGGKDVMPIYGGISVTTHGTSVNGNTMPDLYTDEIFERIAECGINMTVASPQYQESPELIYKTLELGKKHNIGVVISDELIQTEVLNGYVPTTEELGAQVSKYSHYPAFCGVKVVDEPGTEYLQPGTTGQRLIKYYVPIFNSLHDLGIFASGNMFGVNDEFKFDKYKRMLDEYCSTCNPKYLSWDTYVWDTWVKKDIYFQNMDMIRTYANKYKIPFWGYAQAGAQWNDDKKYFDSKEYYPTEGQFHWSVNTLLAAGAKGINYFPLIQPLYFAQAESTDYDFQRNGLLGAYGNKTQWWYYAKDANAQIAAMDSVLMNSVSKGVIATGKEAVSHFKGTDMYMKETSWRELKEVEGNTMIGCFNYYGKSVLYVVNYEWDYAQKITLTLQDTYNMSMIREAKETKITANKLELDMQPGEGVLLVFE